MVECQYCDEEFSSKKELHAHWMEEHEDELNSHKKEKAKRAKRKLEEEKQNKMGERKRLAGMILAGGAALALLVVLGMQLMPSFNGNSGSGTSFDLSDQPVTGNPNASVTVVEFGDYQCPYCNMFDQKLFPRLKSDYIDTGKIRFAFINYAFLGPDSTEAAVAAQCVYKQSSEQYWPYHHAIYDNQGEEGSGWVTKDLLMSVARNSTEGLDYDQLSSCIDSRATSSKVQADKTIGDSHGVQGTPTIFVNGKQVKQWNNYNAIKAAIESELQ
ncbi:MAG: DsbA family protein [Candidatus Nanohaloarchaea archaeon]